MSGCRDSKEVRRSAAAPNHRYRTSKFLDSKTAVDLIQATIHAARIGRPLNRFITITLVRENIDRLRPQQVIGHFLRLACQWLCHRGIPPTYIWVLEHRPGSGIHAHILLHCPPYLIQELDRKVRTAWLRLPGMTVWPGVVKNLSVGRRDAPTDLSAPFRDLHYIDNLTRLLRYLLKGMDPSENSSLDLARVKARRRSTATLFRVKTEENNAIAGRRASRSENIGRRARERGEGKR